MRNVVESAVALCGGGLRKMLLVGVIVGLLSTIGTSYAEGISIETLIEVLRTTLPKPPPEEYPGLGIRNLIIIDGQIADAAVYRKRIMQFQADTSVKDVLVLISSEGGNVIAAFEIYDMLMELRKTKRVVTVGQGLVASAAVILLCAGEERILMPYSLVMIHAPKVWLQRWMAGRGDLTIQAEVLGMIEDMVYGIIGKTSGKSIESIRTEVESKKEIWLTAKKAHEYGLTTRLIK